MAIKQPVKTIEEAFNNSCKKNGISIRKKKANKRSMPIMDEKGDVYILSEDLSIKRKASLGIPKKQGKTKLVLSTENIRASSPMTDTRSSKGNRRSSKKKALVKA